MADTPTTSTGNGGETGAVSVAMKKRESALEKLKRQLADNSAEMPPLEGYSLRKARKILQSAGFPMDRLRVRYIDSEEQRGLVVRQYPEQGEKIDLSNDLYQVELCVADSNVIEFLPSIYQRSDMTGRNFLRDFLWIFEHIFNDTKEKLDNIHTYFDPLETRSEFLPWLASWVAMVLEEDWPELKKRNLIRKAVELYHLRGTVRGIKVYLKIFTGVEPRILENHWPFEGIQVCPYPMDPRDPYTGQEYADPEVRKSAAHPEWKGATIGEDTILMPWVDKAHVFTVELPMQQDRIEVDQIKKIHRILDREKPAHTDYYLIFQPEPEKEEDFGIEVGIRSTIGVDTWTGGGE
jgi:phage tail-like protein